MVDVTLSEEEQVEALKKWWKENGKSVVAGVVIGLGAVFGWQYWNQHQQQMAGQASMLFEQMSQPLAAGNNEVAAKQAEIIISEFQGGTYDTFASLILARVKLEQGDQVGAQAVLKQVEQKESSQPLQQIVRLRLARTLISEGDTEGAAAVVAAAEDDSFRGEFSALKGDIALARGDREGARNAYLEALVTGVGNTAVVRMKLEDLAVVEGS
jgi:predicted negative regulator of RcsB-dependent stress response